MDFTQKIKSIKIEHILLAGFTIVSLIMIFITILSLSEMHSLVVASKLVDHTHQVKQDINEVMEHVVDAESSARGFIITGKESYIEPLNDATVQIPDLLIKLHTLTTDNNYQQNSIFLLDKLVNERIEFSKIVCQIRRSNGLDSAVLFFANGRGKNITDSIRVLTIKMMEEENRLITVRYSNEISRSKQSQLIIIISLVVQLLLLVFIFLYVKKDIINRRKSKKLLLKLNEDLEARVEQRTEEFSKAKAEAEQANAAKSEFLSRMSHELRTPMNSILGFAQLMNMGELNQTQKKGVVQILNNGKHLLDLINEVLDIAKIETGRMTVSPEAVEIFSVITETIGIVGNLAEEKHISIDSEAIVNQKLFVTADYQQLKQVLLNLINNAVKYNKMDGSVKIKCIKGKGTGTLENLIRINIKDSGNGIAHKYLKKLFTPFERLGAERTEIEGTGLGLAISKKLIEAMNGKIGVESEEGKGSTFWIELPESDSIKFRHEKATGLSTSEADIKERCGNILYIEDNLSNIELVEQILEIHRPLIKLITNIYGHNTVKLAIDYRPDLILLDLDLPDINGSEVIKLLQIEPRTREIPVIILSASALTKKIEDLMKSGASGYLIKPIDVDYFLKTIDEWFKGANHD